MQSVLGGWVCRVAVGFRGFGGFGFGFGGVLKCRSLGLGGLARRDFKDELELQGFGI